MTDKVSAKDFIEGLQNTTVDKNKTILGIKDFIIYDVFGTKYRCEGSVEAYETILLDLGADLSTHRYEPPFWVPTTTKKKEVVKEEGVVETKDSSSPDWDWIDSLPATKKSKEELDKYAEEKFNIKLKQSNTLPNMIKDFKEQLA